MRRDGQEASPFVHQLLHGYRRGHEQLAASLRLPSRDTELVTRLSDLSGSLAGAPDFDSYVTAYPLPSRSYFALARTWPDPTAPRAGCVVTHTLLVPLALWAHLPAPEAFRYAFSRPDLSGALTAFSATIPISAFVVKNDDTTVDITSPDVREFTHRYFGFGQRPLIWFGERHAEDILWSLLRGLWPQLRTSFSACTFCLQPRTLDDRAFDLMFAPPSSYSRFLKVSPEYFIDGATQRTARFSEGDDHWVTRSTKQIFQLDARVRGDELHLWNEFDDDPTAMRRFFLIDDLMKRTTAEPQMYVGAMDLVESLAKDGHTAISSKLRVADRAVMSARAAQRTETGLECLRLIEDRLRRASFAGVQEQIGDHIASAVAGFTATDTEATVQSSIFAAPTTDLRDSWMGRGLIKGFRRLTNVEPEKLLILRKAPHLVAPLLVAEPQLGSVLVRTVASHRGDPHVRADLLLWLRRVEDHALRSALRKAILPALEASDKDILEELLTGLEADEVVFVLDAATTRLTEEELDVITEVLAEGVARPYPDETRRWASGLGLWTRGLSRIIAASYATTRQGLVDLLDFDRGRSGSQRAELIAAFVLSLGARGYPSWLREVAKERNDMLAMLLNGGASPSVAPVVKGLLDAVPDLPISNSPELLRMVTESSGLPFYEKLRDVAMRSILPGYISGAVDEAVMRSFQEHPAVVPWLEQIDARDLAFLITNDTWSSERSWCVAWRWATTAPPQLYMREPTLLPFLVGALSRSHHSGWSDEIAEMWTAILRRAAATDLRQSGRLTLNVQALKFAFEHTMFPLSTVAAEAFPYVYGVVTEAERLPHEASSLFGLFDWDKGKELRRSLVDSFYHSQWHPGDLILAAPNAHLLRKLFKRLIRKSGGERYAWSALRDLEQRGKANDPLAEAFRGMLARPDFYEEWE